MDHKDQHHEKHEKQREEHKKEQKEYEAQQEKKGSAIHPGWFLAIGAVLILTATLIWTFAF